MKGLRTNDVSLMQLTKSKLVMKKFINDTNLFIMLESYRRNLILNTMGYFSFQHTERMTEIVTYRTCYEDYVINALKYILVAYMTLLQYAII